MCGKVGTYAWSEASNGLLSRRDKVRVASMLACSQLRQWRVWISHSLGRYTRRLAAIDFDRVTVPDSPLVKEAENEAERIYAQPLLQHCRRSYAFGMLLAQFHGVRPDTERLYLGCLFHDYGLAHRHAHESEHCGFELVGARHAHCLVKKHGWDETRCRVLYESISLHLNPYLSFSDQEVEAVLLQRGATLDVIGAERHLIPTRELDRVHARYPRLGFREAILATMTDIRHPANSRAGFLFSCGFAKLASGNPLDRSIDMAAS